MRAAQPVMRRDRGWASVLAVCVLLLATVGDAKKDKKKKKKFFKEADLLCSACEQMVERVEWNLKDVPSPYNISVQLSLCISLLCLSVPLPVSLCASLSVSPCVCRVHQCYGAGTEKG